MKKSENLQEKLKDMPLENQIQSIAVDLASLDSEITALVIQDDAGQNQAIEYLSNIKDQHSAIESFRKWLIKPHKERVDEINTALKPKLEFLKDKEITVKQALQVYLNEKARLQKIEEEKLRKEKEEKDRLERLRLEEEKRQAEELQKKAAKADIDEALRLSTEAEEKFLAAQAAEKRIEEQKDQPLVPAQPENVKVGNNTFASRKVWKYRITDIVQLQRSRPDLFMVDKQKLDYEVRNLIGIKAIVNIPGVEVYQETVSALYKK